MKHRPSLLAKFFFVLTFLSGSLQATIVEFKTSMGDFEVNLFDEITPETVENFLEYVQQESYHNSVIHRSIPDFIIQGGGFRFQDKLPLQVISANSSISNEPELSNRRGTIAMAKLSNQPNSATNQWFFNLKDNHAGQPQLDTQNGGFTVFGQVSEQGMEILNAIAALPRFNLGGAASEMPLRNYTSADAAAGVEVTIDHLVMIESVVVVDPRIDSAAGLDPVANTLIKEVPSQQPDQSDNSGGSFSWWLLALAALVSTRRFLTLR